MKRKVSEMEVDAAPAVEESGKSVDTDTAAPMKKRRKPSIDVDSFLSLAVSSLPDLAPEDIADLLRRSGSNPSKVGKAVVKRCKQVENYDEYLSEDEKKSFTAIKGLSDPEDMKEVKTLTDMQRVALRYHMHKLRNIEADYLGKSKIKKSNDTKNGDEDSMEVEKKKQKPLKKFVGENVKCPAIPKNHRRTIEMKMKRIDKNNPVKDLKKKLQEELKQVLSDAGKLKKDALAESLNDCKDWERDSVYFTTRKLAKSLTSDQKYAKKELAYFRCHINKTKQMIGYAQDPKSKPSPVKKGKENKKVTPAKKKTKVTPAKKAKGTNKNVAKKVEEEEEEEVISDEEMSEGKEFDDETQAHSDHSDDDDN